MDRAVSLLLKPYAIRWMRWLADAPYRKMDFSLQLKMLM